MTAPRQKAVSNTLQAQILEQLTEVKGKVDESLGLGRDNNNELKMLRRELGLDGQHGRLPLVETAVAQHEIRITAIERGGEQVKGRSQFIADARGFLSGSLGAALLGLIAHWCHWIK